ncbi:MAG: type II toxin-antitoxin system HicB family antitoxin [Methanomicrobiales archaeon]
MSRYHFTIAIWEEKGTYVAKSAELEVTSCGDTPSQALENIREAIDLYLKNAEEYGMLDEINAAISSQEKFTAVIEVQV